MSQTKLHVRKGDRVKVIAGKDRGLVGEVIAVYPDKNRVTVAGVNIVKRPCQGHRQPAAEPAGQQGRDHLLRGPDPRVQRPAGGEERDGNEVVTRIGYERVEVTKRRPDGSEYKSHRSVRIARATGEEV
jgi:large subunit ribosomal protein L24